MKISAQIEKVTKPIIEGGEREEKISPKFEKKNKELPA
jgi:hypothetical protein